MCSKQQTIASTITFVKDTLNKAEAGHDWWHIYRVWNLAKHIAQHEKVDLFIVEMASLLHDIADSKFNNGDESIGPKTAQTFLKKLNIDTETSNHIVAIIEHMSFKNSFDKFDFTSPEFKVVQDADRLDAIGAMGVARAFSYGGFKKREMYNPEIKPEINQSKEQYKQSTAPTINHFYEKLFKLKDLMHTQTAKQMAVQRHQFMHLYLNQFYAEWEGKL